MAKIPVVTMIKQSAQNMNNVKSETYGISPQRHRKKSLSSEKFKTSFNFKRIEQSKKVSHRLDRYNQIKSVATKKNMGKFRCR